MKRIVVILSIVLLGTIAMMAQRQLIDLPRPDSSQSSGPVISHIRPENPIGDGSEIINQHIVPIKVDTIRLHDSLLVVEPYYDAITTPFGDIPHSAVVGNDGRVNIDVPIETFATEYEYAPSISLFYNAQNYFDYLGTGWQLKGIPCITRISKNYFTDGNTDAVKMTADDAFALDGNRLIFQSESGTKRTYITQSGNDRAVFDTAANSFVVYYANGDIATFTTQNSLTYLMVSMTTHQGGSLTLNYAPSGVGSELPGYIEYGENRTIQFEYESTADEVTLYQAGTAVTRSVHLKNINVYQDQNLLTTYRIVYNSPMVQAQPNCVRRFDSNGDELRPLRFEYKHGGASTYANGSSSTVNNETAPYFKLDQIDTGVNFLRGNFDPTTEDDGYIVYQNKNSYYLDGRQVKTEYKSTDKFIVGVSLPADGSSVEAQEFTMGTGFVDVFAMDVDGHTGDEIVKINNYYESGADKLVFTIYKYMPSTQSIVLDESHTFNLSAFYNNGTATIRPKSFVQGDFDGDGMMELAVVYPKPAGSSLQPLVDLYDLNTMTRKVRVTLDEYTTTLLQHNDDYSSARSKIKSSNTLVAIDHDGDGKLSLGVVIPEGTQLYTFSKNDAGNTVMQKDIVLSTLTMGKLQNYHVAVAELNGDETGDLLFFRDTATDNVDIDDIQAFTGRGDGTFVQTGFIKFENRTQRQFVLADINRDGLTDVLAYVKSNAATYTLNTFLARHGQLNRMTDIEMPRRAVVMPANQYAGVKVNSIRALLADGTISSFSYLVPYDLCMQLTAVVDSYKNRREFEFSRQSSDNDLNMGYLEYEFPYAYYAGGRVVCTANKLTSSNQVASNISYGYSGGVVHRQGLGFCGFKKVTLADAITGDESVQRYDPLKLGAPLSVDNNKERYDYDYALTFTTDRRIEMRLMGLRHYDKATNVADSTSYTYDSYGNVKNEIRTWPGDYQVTTHRNYSNVVDDTHNLIGLQVWEEKSINRNGEWDIRGTTTTYNSDWFPQTVKNYYTSVNIVTSTTTYEYDDHRNVISVTTKDYNDPEIETTYTYGGSSGKLLTSKEDARGRHIDYTYGPFGLTKEAMLLQTKYLDNPLPMANDANLSTTKGIADMNGGFKPFDPPTPIYKFDQRVTGYAYDSFGQRISTTTADSIHHIVRGEWVENGNSPTISYKIVETAENKPTQTLYYNGMGQNVRTEQVRFDNSIKASTKTYDNRGRLVAEEQLERGCNYGVEQTTSYDDFDRPIQQQLDGMVTASYSYSGLSTTKTEQGVTSTLTVDPLGAVIRVNDDGGVIEYTLQGDGQPLSVTHNNAIVTTFEYGSFGRRQVISDPSGGERYILYGLSKYPYAEYDADGRSVKMTYNQWGDVTKRIFDDETTVNYTYNTDGAIKSIIDTNGHSSYYSYDNAGRLVSEETDGFKKVYTYGTGDVVTEVAYYKNNEYICAENREYANGTLTTIKLKDGDVIWQLLQEDDYYYPWRNKLGNKAIETHTRNDYGYLTTHRVYVNSRYKVKNKYDYNITTGNLMSRRDLVHGTGYEYFEYDSQNRLTRFDGNDVEYDVNGNVTYRESMGNMAYSGSRPYAVSQAELATANQLVPTTEQRIVYNAMQRPDSIMQGGMIATFDYRGDRSRAMMTIADSAGIKRRVRYYDMTYNEVDAGENTPCRRILYLGGNPYHAPAALVYDEEVSNEWELLYIVRDPLGSITHLIDTDGDVVQELSYDAWGNLRDPDSHELYDYNDQPEPYLLRGYTGHEHLGEFGLINMNARLYDPTTGQFLSPDPRIDAADITIGYNRYTYCLNNPLRYTDENGEFILGLLCGFFKGLFLGKNPFKMAGETFVNEYKIIGGLFNLDWSKGVFSCAAEFVRRFTWELPQTVLGFTASMLFNDFTTRVDRVDYFGGATFLTNENASSSWGVTLGNYINMQINDNIEDRFSQRMKSDDLYMHEYGHYLDSHYCGPLYYLLIGIPSLMSEIFDPGNHKEFWTEKRADNLASIYFQRDWYIAIQKKETGKSSSSQHQAFTLPGNFDSVFPQ